MAGEGFDLPLKKKWGYFFLFLATLLFATGMVLNHVVFTRMDLARYHESSMVYFRFFDSRIHYGDVYDLSLFMMTGALVMAFATFLAFDRKV